MSMLKEKFENAKKPQGEFGEFILSNMNNSHNVGATWAISKLALDNVEKVLDIGCGGGKNISNFLEHVPNAHITGIDYSETSVKKSVEFNRKAVDENRVDVILGDVSSLPFNEESFDIITAFETVYFWPEIEKCFADIYKILKPNGCFMVCNEVSTQEQFDLWGNLIEMNFYSPETLKVLMQNSGFEDIEIYIHDDKHWSCVIGKK